MLTDVNNIWQECSGVNLQQIISWPWNLGYRSLRVIETGTIRKLGNVFLFAFHKLALFPIICEIKQDIGRRSRFFRTPLHCITHWSTCDISWRSAITRAAMQSLENQIWRSRLAISVKLKLYNTCILPIFLYGSDCWAISKMDARKIDALNQWCLRMLLGIKWYQFVRNDDVRRRLTGSTLSSMRIICPNRIRRRNWIIAVSLGCFISLRTSSFRTN